MARQESKPMKKHLMVAQSGGPTAAINASLAGVIRGALESGAYDRIYGAVHGISGVLEENFLELSECAKKEGFLECLSRTPAMYLGSCRMKMPVPADDPAIYDQIFSTLERMEIAAFFYIGGNDSMDTVAKLSKEAERRGSEIRFAGVPKTIDNDLIHTDHTPGYGSAAKYIATSMLEIAHDTYIYDLPCVTIVEIMGRDSGWLTAAAALARNEYNITPQLLYLPEVPFRKEVFLEDIRRELARSKNVVVAVSEGIRDKDGIYISAKEAVADKFGHMQLSGVGKRLEQLVKKEVGTKVRSIELSILQRCAGHVASSCDLEESCELGAYAVKKTAEGETGFMASVHRLSDEPYTYEICCEGLQEIANKAKTVPREWINEAGNDVTEEMLRYIRPLIVGEAGVGWKDGLPVYLPVAHLNHIGE